MLTDGLEWCGLLWCFYQTLILTAPIHCRASIAETLIQTWWRHKLILISDEHMWSEFKCDLCAVVSGAVVEDVDLTAGGLKDRVTRALRRIWSGRIRTEILSRLSSAVTPVSLLSLMLMQNCASFSQTDFIVFFQSLIRTSLFSRHRLDSPSPPRAWPLPSGHWCPATGTIWPPARAKQTQTVWVWSWWCSALSVKLITITLNIQIHIWTTIQHHVIYHRFLCIIQRKLIKYQIERLYIIVVLFIFILSLFCKNR